MRIIVNCTGGGSHSMVCTAGAALVLQQGSCRPEAFRLTAALAHADAAGQHNCAGAEALHSEERR
jgi:hypothetical protein